MRSITYALLISLASACCASATAQVTLVLQFDARHSEQSISEMKRELHSLMQNSGVELNWRQLGELSASDSFASLIVVRFRGRCEMQAQTPALPGQPVALGYTYLADGNVIPFADVECDQIRSSLASAETGYSMHSDVLLGRAMGRVLAHELHHIIGRTRAHTEHGILRKALSPRDLALTSFK